jgi:hypothetical protein
MRVGAAGDQLERSIARLVKRGKPLGLVEGSGQHPPAAIAACAHLSGASRVETRHGRSIGRSDWFI